MFLVLFLATVLNTYVLGLTRIETIESLCSSPIGSQSIRLPNATMALVLNQSRINDHPIDWRYSINCNFTVRIANLLSILPRQNSLALVVTIQHLFLRQNQTTGECIDFVQFKTKRISAKDSVNDRKYCGRLATDELGNLVHVYDPYGKIETHIQIDKRALDPQIQLELLLIYTPVKLCSSEVFNSFVKCETTQPEICIHETFVNDSFANCPSCVDEGGCKFRTKVSSTVGRFATVAAFTIIVIGLVLFLSCIWFCKKFSVLCWTENFVSSRPDIRNSVELNIHGSSIAAHGGESTTPSFESVNTKDLPPPYESLFPDR